jgi:hypothetical protein
MRTEDKMTSVFRSYGTLCVGFLLAVTAVLAGPVRAQAPERKPNILVIFGDDIGQTNVSAYSFGVMGYKTPNIDLSYPSEARRRSSRSMARATSSARAA